MWQGLRVAQGDREQVGVCDLPIPQEPGLAEVAMTCLDRRHPGQNVVPQRVIGLVATRMPPGRLGPSSRTSRIGRDAQKADAWVARGSSPRRTIAWTIWSRRAPPGDQRSARPTCPATSTSQGVSPRPRAACTVASRSGAGPDDSIRPESRCMVALLVWTIGAPSGPMPTITRPIDLPCRRARSFAALRRSSSSNRGALAHSMDPRMMC